MFSFITLEIFSVRQWKGRAGRFFPQRDTERERREYGYLDMGGKKGGKDLLLHVPGDLRRKRILRWRRVRRRENA